MPQYEYICSTCRDVDELFFHIGDDMRPHRLDCRCGGKKRRKFSFAITETFEPHFNHSVGAYVTSKNDMKEKLKNGADERYQRTGIPHSYEMIDKAEVKDSDVGVDDAGMRETHDAAVKAGLKAPTGKTVL